MQPRKVENVCREKGGEVHGPLAETSIAHLGDEEARFASYVENRSCFKPDSPRSEIGDR